MNIRTTEGEKIKEKSEEYRNKIGRVRGRKRKEV